MQKLDGSPLGYIDDVCVTISWYHEAVVGYPGLATRVLGNWPMFTDHGTFIITTAGYE